MVKSYRNKSGANVLETSVAPFNPILSVPLSSFVSNNTHYTAREILSPNEVRFSILSTLNLSGDPVDELTPRFTATREIADPPLSTKKNRGALETVAKEIQVVTEQK